MALFGKLFKSISGHFTVVGALNECFVAALTPDEVLQTRIGAVPILIATSALFGHWRDMVHCATGFALRGQVLRVWIDTASCLCFRVPVYGSILLMGGAEGGELARGLAGGTAIILLSGRPCGLTIDMARYFAGIERTNAD